LFAGYRFETIFHLHTLPETASVYSFVTIVNISKTLKISDSSNLKYTLPQTGSANQWVAKRIQQQEKSAIGSLSESVQHP